MKGAKIYDTVNASIVMYTLKGSRLVMRAEQVDDTARMGRHQRNITRSTNQMSPAKCNRAISDLATRPSKYAPDRHLVGILEVLYHRSNVRQLNQAAAVTKYQRIFGMTDAGAGTCTSRSITPCFQQVKSPRA